MSDPAWARGIDLAFLKSIAGIFAPEFKPHTHGAFGLPKERDIADAHALHRLIWTKDRAGAAIFNVLRSGSQHTDFAGRIARPQAGDLFIKAIAGMRASKLKIIQELHRRSNAPAVWIEGHVEGPIGEQIEDVGFRLVMTKVAASSDLKGLWVYGQTAGRLPGPLAEADRPALAQLDLRFLSADDRRIVLGELAAFGDRWADHYSAYNRRGSWSAIALRGYDAADPGFIIKPAEMSKAWKAEHPARLRDACGPTTAAEHFPGTLAIVDRIPGPKQRVRFMRLAAKGGELSRHADITDPDAGTADGKVARLHVPIITDPACYFIGWGMDGRRIEQHFPARSLCYLDTRKPHSAINSGSDDRVHLVIDCHSGPELRAMIEAGLDG